MKKRHKNKQLENGESGNVLWFILLAVALMGALTATISRSTDTAEQSGNIERFRINASDIMRYTASVQAGIENMRLTGIGENQVSFENSFTSADYSNGSCSDCLVFSSTGGGTSYRTVQETWLDTGHVGDTNYGEWEFIGTNAVADVGRSANAELIMVLNYLKQGLCAQINVMNDIDGIPEDSDGFDQTAFQGSFANTATIETTGGELDGVETGCFFYDPPPTGDPEYTYYQVLIKR